MSHLPAKPEFARSGSGDERRPGGPGRGSPDRYSHPWDDRDGRDRDRGHRSRYTHSGPRSPPARSTDTYISGSRGREYRSYDDTRSWDDRRDRDRDRDRDMDRDRGYYRRHRVDDTWTPRRDYSPPNRRGFIPRESERRSRDDYRRDRDRERERGRSRDRDDQWPRDREHDRQLGSPTYRPVPLSPRRDHRELHSPPPPRRPPPSYPSRGRRSISPRSIGSRSRRSSPARAPPESEYTHRDIPRPPKTPSPRRTSPRHRSRPLSSPIRERHSPVRELHHHEEPSGQVAASEPEPVQAEDRLVEDAATLDGDMDIQRSTESLTKGDDNNGESHGKAELGSPMACQERLMPTVDTVAKSPAEVVVTQPYLPSIPRYEAKPKFSAGYENEYDRLETHRAHAAAECRRCLKGSRRANHELEMTTLDLRAAQHRRELAEAHRKKAHHGQLGIDAEIV